MRYIFTILFFIVGICGYTQSVIKIDSSFNAVGFSNINLDTSQINMQYGTQLLVNPSDQHYLVRAFNHPLGAFIKYKRDGKPDSSFNNTGVLIQPNSEYFKGQFFLQPDHKIIHASTSPAITAHPRFFRTLPNGVTDSTFGTDGMQEVTGALNAPGNYYKTMDGGFLFVNALVKGTHPNFYYELTLIKINSNYTVDSSFGSNGTKTHQLGYRSLELGGAVIDQNGKLTLSTAVDLGTGNDPFLFKPRIMRFLPNGEFDPSFGQAGIVEIDSQNWPNGKFTDCQLQRDGKIVLVGTIRNSINNEYGFAMRVLENGTIDSTFGTFGITILPELIRSNTLQLQRDGKILITGWGPFPIVRLTEDGARDEQFGENAIYTTPFTDVQSSFGNAILLESDSTFLITGNIEKSNRFYATTARYKIAPQPLIEGLKSKPCLEETINAQIINMPKAGSDTTVHAKIDNLNITVTPSGQFTFSAGAAGSHILEVTFAKGSESWRQLHKFITYKHITPVITTSAQHICSNSTFELSANVPVYWQGPGINDSIFQDSLSKTFFVSTSLNGPLQFIATSDNGSCGAKSDTVILTPTTIEPAITQNGTTLTTPLHIGSVYKWYLNNVLIPGAISNTHIASQNGVYTVNETLGSCSITSAATNVVSVPDPIPAPQITNVPATLCSNIISHRSKLSNPPPAPASISISRDGISLNTYNPSDSSFTFGPHTVGTHNIRVTYSLASATQIKEFEFNTVQAPGSGAAPVTNGNVLSIPVSGSSYQWYKNGTLIPGEISNQLTITESASYSYTYTQNGCTSDISAALNVTITGIIDPDTNKPIGIAPNPVAQDFYITGLQAINRYEISISDISGSILNRQIVNGGPSVMIKTNGLTNGVYFVKIRNTNGTALLGSQKIIVVN